MNFTNETPFPAELLSTIIDAERMTASLVARVTYAMEGGPQKRLVVASEQPWKVSRTPWESPRGTMEQDLPYMKGGVDLFMWGKARAPGGVPVESMEVAVELSPAWETEGRTPFVRRARVTGKRVWIRRDGVHLVPSATAAFLEVPLTLDRAFGGKGVFDGLDVPWMENAAGIGFVMEEEKVEGSPLPQIEDPDAPVRAWTDRPPVCGFGFCPLVNQARFRNGLVLADDGEIKELRAEMFNAAYPPMIAKEARPGDVLRVHGVLADGPLAIVLPEPPILLRLRFGEKLAERVPTIDQIGVEVDEGRVFVTYRFPFRYTVRLFELRDATLITRKA